MTASAAELLGWDDIARRDLPWPNPGVTAWQILVSEFMLQQTPVARVQPSFPPPEPATVIDRFEARLAAVEECDLRSAPPQPPPTPTTQPKSSVTITLLTVNSRRDSVDC
jgi:hypothetical protein